MKKRPETIDYRAKETTPHVQPLLLNQGSAATMLGISERSLFSLVKRGEVHARRLGGRKLFHIDDIRRYAAGLPTRSVGGSADRDEQD